MRNRHLTKRQTARFCGQLKMLLASGVPLLEGLQIIRDMSPRKEYEGLIQQISEGESLAKAMEEHFPPLVTSSIESAEKSGNLEEVLGRLNKFYEDRVEVEEKIKSALIYPGFVVVLCLVSLFVLLLFVLPGFKSLFADLDAELPLLTRIIISGGEVFSRTWYIQIIFLLLLGVVLRYYRKTERGAQALDRLGLRFRFLCREHIIQSFRTLGSLLAGGVPMLEALNTTAHSSKNRVFREIIFDIKAAIQNGERLSEVAARHKIFPEESIQMIAVGENSGKLDQMLLSISDFYEKEREHLIKRFTTMLEPALTLFVGVMVGIIVLVMFLPMLNMISRLQ